MMKYFAPERFNQTMQAVLDHLDEREVPAVPLSATFDEILDVISRLVHSRMVFVVDENQRLAGAIDLGTIVSQAFFDYLQPQIHPRGIMRQITSEHAKHLMRRKILSARIDDEIAEVLDNMIENQIEEVPIVDREGHLAGDVTMVDIIRFLNQD